MAKVATTIWDKNGNAKAGYIENGKTYYNNGTRISVGSKVIDNSGREWVMGDNGGTETGNNYSSRGNQGAYKGNTYGETSDSYDGHDYILDARSQIEKANAESIRQQEIALQASINQEVGQINAQRPAIEQRYGKANTKAERRKA